MSRAHATHASSWQSKFEKLVARAFAVDGWLVEQGLRHLPVQADYAGAVARWLLGAAEQPFGFVEGDTGTGKTLGYLIPLTLYASLSGQRVGVSTFSIYLQRQMLAAGGDMERAQDYLQASKLPRVPVAQYLGRTQYVDPNRVLLRLAELRAEGRAGADHDLFLQWALHSSESGSGVTRDWIDLYGKLPTGITLDGVGCQERATPAMHAAREAVYGAQLVVTSHTALVWDAVSRGGMLTDKDTQLGLRAIVVDEGDQLEVAAEDVMRQQVQPHHLQQLCSDLAENFSGPERAKATRAAKRFGELQGLLDQIGEQSPKTKLTSGLSPTEQNALLEKIDNCRERVKAVLELGADITQELVLALRVLDRIRYTMESVSNWQICGVSWSPVRRYPSLIVQSTSPLASVSYGWSKHIAERPRILLTSATLSSRAGLPDFAMIRRDLRLTADTVAIAESFAPVKFGSMSFVVPGASMPPVYLYDDDDERAEEAPLLNAEWVAATARMIGDAMATGRTLVLCTSYREADAIARYVGDDLILHRPGQPLAELTQSFCEGKARALISPGCWEGVSLRLKNGKPAFNQCVITRIPYAPPSVNEELSAQNLVDMRVVPTERAAFKLLHSIRMQAVRRRLRQGFGRGIRAVTDHVTVWIADPRFPSHVPCKNNRRDTLLQSIPARFIKKFRAADVWEANQHAITAPQKKRLFG